MKKTKSLLLAAGVLAGVSVTAMAAPIENVDLGSTRYYSGTEATVTHEQVMNNMAELNRILEKDHGWSKAGLATSYKQFHDNKEKLKEALGSSFLSGMLDAADAKMVKLLAKEFKLEEDQVKDFYANPNGTYTGEQKELQDASTTAYRARMMETDLINALPKAVDKLNEVIAGVNANMAALEGKADVDAGNLTAENVSAWQDKLGGTIAEGEKGFVSGNDVHALGLAISEGLVGKANTDASNILGDDVLAWQSTLGTGKVAEGDKGLVKGETVKAALDGVVAEQKKVDAAQNKRLDGIDSRIDAVETTVERTGALSGALAGLKPMQYDPMAPTQVMGAIGVYKGEQGYALGVAHYAKEDLMLHAGIAYDGHDDLMGNVGLTWKVGSSADKAGIPARYQAGPISSIYVMQEENERMQEHIAYQDARIAQLEAMVQELMAK